MDYKTILIQAAIIFLQIIIREAPSIIDRAVERAGELERNTENLNSREKCDKLKEWLRKELPSARSYMINLLAEVAVSIMKKRLDVA